MSEEQLVKLMQLDEQQEALLREIEEKLAKLYESCMFVMNPCDSLDIRVINLDRFEEVDMSDYPLDSDDKRNGWNVLPYQRARIMNFTHIDDMGAYDDLIAKVSPNNLF